MSKKVLIAFGVLAALALLIQLVPYGRNHTNPPVVAEPSWDGAETKALYDRACADCHSHQTVWPWYSNIAPVSWLVQHDVEEGREHLNTSEWGTKRIETHEVGEVIREGEMPMRVFLITHPEARLTQAEKDAHAQGLIATFSQ